MLNDIEFLQQFETCTLAPEHFDHKGHLRLAMLYLTHHSLPEAIDKTTSGIARYAASLGATDKFHHTLTEATVRIIGQRFNTQNKVSFDTFMQHNPDLVTDLKSVIAQHYSEQCLNTIDAKRRFVEPDLKPFTDANDLHD